MAAKSIKLSTTIIICIAVAAASFYAGYEAALSLVPSCDGCCSTCEEELAIAEAKLERAYVISESGPGRDEVTLREADDLMRNFAGSAFARIPNYRGMNLHLNHLEQMIRYHLDLGSTAHGGFRIYHGLIPSGTGTEADIRQLIVPLNTDGSVSMPATTIWSFDPNDNFELPCPTRCD